MGGGSSISNLPKLHRQQVRTRGPQRKTGRLPSGERAGPQVPQVTALLSRPIPSGPRAFPAWKYQLPSPTLPYRWDRAGELTPSRHWDISQAWPPTPSCVTLSESFFLYEPQFPPL